MEYKRAGIAMSRAMTGDTCMHVGQGRIRLSEDQTHKKLLRVSPQPEVFYSFHRSLVVLALSGRKQQWLAQLLLLWPRTTLYRGCSISDPCSSASWANARLRRLTTQLRHRLGNNFLSRMLEKDGFRLFFLNCAFPDHGAVQLLTLCHCRPLSLPSS